MRTKRRKIGTKSLRKLKIEDLRSPPEADKFLNKKRGRRRGIRAAEFPCFKYEPFKSFLLEEDLKKYKKQ
jgi:uroporphyrinogen-III synthase